jgi:Domain of unknown function (DUF397)
MSDCLCTLPGPSSGSVTTSGRWFPTEVVDASVQLSAAWTKSSHSVNGDCVEVRLNGSGVEVRDSKLPHGPTLAFSYREWSAFLRGVHDGEFEFESSRGMCDPGRGA